MPDPIPVAQPAPVPPIDPAVLTKVKEYVLTIAHSGPALNKLRNDLNGGQLNAIPGLKLSEYMAGYICAQLGTIWEIDPDTGHAKVIDGVAK